MIKIHRLLLTIPRCSGLTLVQDMVACNFEEQDNKLSPRKIQYPKVKDQDNKYLDIKPNQ